MITCSFTEQPCEALSRTQSLSHNSTCIHLYFYIWSSSVSTKIQVRGNRSRVLYLTIFFSGNGDGFFSSQFQATLEGNELYDQKVPECKKALSVLFFVRVVCLLSLSPNFSTNLIYYSYLHHFISFSFSIWFSDHTQEP